ncbi:MAG: pilus assembly protein [Geminicoccaceae bacterium]|nr:pilus assembly protein [Geminicoccaceae bacterium]
MVLGYARARLRALGRLCRRLRDCAQDERASVAVEAALVAPVLVLLFVGAAELGWLYLARLKTERAAAAVADLAARAGELREADIRDVFRAAAGVLEPLDLFRDGRAFLSNVVNTTGLPVIRWQRASAPGLATTSRIGSQGGPAALAGGPALRLGEEVVVGEAELAVRPLLGILVRAPARYYARAVQRPRFGTVIFVPG